MSNQTKQKTMEITNNLLKEYCSYLMDVYEKANPHYEDSRIYIMLKEYNDTGVMKDMIFEGTSKETVSEILSHLAEKINNFCNERELYLREYKIKKIHKQEI